MPKKRPGPIKRISYGICALICTWVGLGMFGIVSGWQRTDTGTAKIFGVACLIAGFFLIRTVIDPGAQEESPPEPPEEEK